MRAILLILALILALSVLGAWVATGSDLGWTKTQVAVMRVDSVTELEYPDWENRLILGVDFLALGLAGSLALAAAGIFLPMIFRKPNKPTQQNP